jgi:uncharacterized protein (DUF1501 family)
MVRDRIERRTFLRASGAGFASFALPLPRGHLQHAFAGEEEQRPTLVVLFLRGGADALNVVVPYADERYHEMRPTLAIPAEATAERAGVLRLDDDFGLHPSLASLLPAWKEKRLAPVLAVGSPHPTRSHFDAQDFMEYAAPGLRTVRAGWLNRYLAQTERARAAAGAAPRPEGLRVLAMQGLLPRSLRGEVPVLAVPQRNVLGDERLQEQFEPLYGKSPEGEELAAMGERAERESVLASGRETLQALARFRAIVGQGREAAGAYPPGKFGAALRDLARVIRAGEELEVAALDLIGWDTHVDQGATGGAMPNLLATLADSLTAFMDDLGPHRERTLVLAMSEFGRTCRENGNYGTDHGHGGVMLLLGGAVAGGRLHGRWTGLEEKNLYERRDLLVTTDFRDVFAEVLRNHFRFEVPADFFPGYKAGRVRGLFG